MNDQRRYVDIYSAVPQELKERRQWVMWRWAKREDEDKPTKPPYKPTSRFLNRQKAKNNDPYTWTDFQSVCKPRLSDTPCFGVLPEDYDDRGTECGCVFSGIGYVFSEDDPYCGIDLDDCLYRDENGKIQIKPWAQPIIDMLTPVAYAEVSPSGNGIKFWTRATLPEGIRHKAYIVIGADAIEAYDRLRYFTVTGRGKGVIADGRDAIDWLVEQHLTPESAPQPLSNPQPTAPEQTTQDTNSANRTLSADEVIAQIRKSKNRHQFDALMAGDITDYGSQSEADMRLCYIIAFWTQDPTVIDTIFRQSKLYRKKWEEKHWSTGGEKALRYGERYGEHTINKAIATTSETYTPPRHDYHIQRSIYRRRDYR